MHTLVHEQLIQFYRGFKHDAHPMAIMVSRRMSVPSCSCHHCMPSLQVILMQETAHL